MVNKVDIKSNFSELAEFIGSAEGWAETVKTPYHISELIRAAHGNTTKIFDQEAAASAKALGFSHMYEWGAAGINDAEGVAPINPTTRAARLWAHRLTGVGTTRGIDFTFRPSKVYVPLPTDVGSATGKQRPKRRHIFGAKAWIAELGIPVVIKPKYSQVLFISHRGQPGGVDDRANLRGYSITPYPVTVPGSKNAGNFTRFWYAWWAIEGKKFIEEQAKAMTDNDAAAVIKTGRGRGQSLAKYSDGYKHAKTFNLQVQTAKALANAEMKIRESKSLRRWQREEAEENIGIMRGME